MNTDDMFLDIVGMLDVIKDDDKKLLSVLSFLESQILNEGNEFKAHEIPEEYRTTIMQIAEALSLGFVCYLNPTTMEIDQVENMGLYENETYREQNDDLLDEFELEYGKWDDYIKFEPLDANDTLLIMQKFVTQLHDSELSRKLESVLGEEKPVTKFRRIIDHSDKKSAWESYLNQALIEYVSTRLQDQLRLR